MTTSIWERIKSRRANMRGYRYRKTPVPGIHRYHCRSSFFRCPSTHNEKASNALFDQNEAKEYRINIRRCRLGKNLPDNYDDFNYARRGNNWKYYRSTRYKTK